MVESIGVETLGGVFTPLLEAGCRQPCVVKEIVSIAPMTAPESFSLPAPDELGRGALELLRRHFAAVNADDRESFRETAYLFDFVDGQPFELWWLGLRSLTPMTLSMSLRSVDDRVFFGKEPHGVIWVHVEARSESTGREYSDDFVVWYLLRSHSWKLACRIHWHLLDSTVPCR
ncbi:MAG: hypothetical protein HOW73_06755 [Polyangiaceae bacterium]|nr:hypothetical protein [Polyangiaceae bacterium]